MVVVVHGQGVAVVVEVVMMVVVHGREGDGGGVTWVRGDGGGAWSRG